MTEIQPLSNEDALGIATVINEAAKRYEGAIPDDLYGEPYMPLDELKGEMSSILYMVDPIFQYNLQRCIVQIAVIK